MGASRRTGFLGIAVALATAGSPAAFGQNQPAAAGPATFLARGTRSCSTSSCHGGVRPSADGVPAKFPDGRTQFPPILRNEYSTWSGADNHSKAYDVLTSERSASIAKKLPAEKTPRELALFPDAAKAPDGKPLGYKPAFENERCLACHSTFIETKASTEDTPPLRAAIRDGVSCESCHGASDQWIKLHNEPDHWNVGWSSNPQFQKANVASKTPLGYIANDDLATRAQNCAGCHIGAKAGVNGIPLRDVDHDLIAAGHPRLYFEMTSYLSKMEKHCSATPACRTAMRTSPPASGPSARLPRRRPPSTSWPTAPPGPRPRSTARPGPSSPSSTASPATTTSRTSPGGELASTPVTGRPRWGTWHYPMLDVLAAAEAGTLSPIPDALTQLRTEMLHPSPDAAKVVELAGTASKELDGWLQQLAGGTYDEARVQRLLTAYKELQKPGLLKSWDEATQRYLALVPLTQAYDSLTGGQPNASWNAELATLAKILTYPKGFESPVGFDPTKPATPTP
ncbi:MAG: multiheme c-type cytochrome [Isosphaeraceae bacterium]